MCTPCRRCIASSHLRLRVRSSVIAALFGAALSAGAQDASPLAQGAAELRANHPQQALALFEQAITAAPESAEANLLAASAELQLYNGADAVRYAQRAQALAPGDWKIHTTLVTAYAMAGDTPHRDTERVYLRKAHEDGTLPDARETSGFLLDRFRAGRYSVDAVEYFKPLGRYNTYYRFLVRNAAGARVWVIEVNSDSLNQSSWAAQYPREARQGQRQFQIESAQGPNHVEYRTFSGAPSYDYMKTQVAKIVGAQTKPFPGEGSLQ